MFSLVRNRKCAPFVLLLLFWFQTSAAESAQNATAGYTLLTEEQHHTDDGGEAHAHHREVPERYPVAQLNWHHVETPYLISLWVLFASYAKIAFHLTDKLAKIFPESCLLILLGLVVGVIIYFAAKDVVGQYTLSSDTFFLFLLPPIVLEAGYFMPNRSFFDNIGTILLYAVIGTLFNCFCIGASLYGIVSLGWVDVEMDLLDCLVFSSLISAVDPVAVLAVFEEVHVNEVLYILVFGESLLNDAVTVVLYSMFKQFGAMGVENIKTVDYVLGLTSFFVISVGGTLIGVVWGLLTAFVTKFTDHVRVIEPLFVFVMSYLSYLTAEVFGFSGIMAIVFCGIIMKKYVEANISQKSHTTIKYFMKMLSSISETIIFMFLGLSAVRDDHVWDIEFIICTLFFCLFFRAVGVILLTALANWFRAVKVNKVEQFIMAYGGLRGAIAFSLVILIEAPTPALEMKKELMVTTTMIVVFFTVFVQGMTIKPLVDKLKVKRSNKHKPTMGEKIFTRLLDHSMAGIEDIIGSHGHNYWRDKYEEMDRKYLQPLLLRELPESKDTQILQVYTNLNIKDAMEYVKSAGSFNIYRGTGSMANFLRRNASQSILGQDSEGSLRTIPHGMSGICLDMQSVGGAGELAAREVDDAELHHLQDMVLSSMHQPSRKGRYRRAKHNMHDNEMGNGENLLHRSVHLHLRHVVKQRRKRAKLAKRTGGNGGNSGPTVVENGVQKLTVPDLQNIEVDGRLKASGGGSFSGGPVEVKVHPPEIQRLDSEGDDEGGITFEARPVLMEKAPLFTISEDETDPLLTASPPPSIHTDGASEMEEDEEDGIEPTAAESWLPWKEYTDQPRVSERAKEETLGIFGIPGEVTITPKECDEGELAGIVRERRNSLQTPAPMLLSRRGSGDSVNAVPKGSNVLRKLLLRRQSETIPPHLYNSLMPPVSPSRTRRFSDVRPYEYHAVPQDDNFGDSPTQTSKNHSPQFPRHHHHHHHHHEHHPHREKDHPDDESTLQAVEEKNNGNIALVPEIVLSSPKSQDDVRIDISDESLEKESSV
ncbi:sodium/hydrogen exchanger 3-like isoform X2 [Ptychodera flava]|uniref:sodium/hydrogen exchanger 3-like isoform X2 n=1 Tax=Ptychodera flava TaxID=63121 RepID=UPI00396A3F4A